MTVPRSGRLGSLSSEGGIEQRIRRCGGESEASSSGWQGRRFRHLASTPRTRRGSGSDKVVLSGSIDDVLKQLQDQIEELKERGQAVGFGRRNGSEATERRHWRRLTEGERQGRSMERRTATGGSSRVNAPQGGRSDRSRRGDQQVESGALPAQGKLGIDTQGIWRDPGENPEARRQRRRHTGPRVAPSSYELDQAVP